MALFQAIFTRIYRITFLSYGTFEVAQMSKTLPETLTNESGVPMNGRVQFCIHDMILGELLCQAGILSDTELLLIKKTAERFGASVGSVMTGLGSATPEQIFRVRLIAARFIREKIDTEAAIKALKEIMPATQRDSGKRVSSLITISRLVERKVS